MMAGLSLVLVLLAFCRESHSLTGTPAYDANCDSNYKSRNSQHTMCLTAGPGTAVTVDKDDVVSYHNQKRAATTNAADLFRVYWDDEVAKVAEHWAKQCGQYGAHDDDRSAYTLPDTYIGQNMAYNYATFRDAIDAWYSEINNFLFGSGTTDASKAVGHYTQMVSKDVYRIGCGQASCANGVYYICNYVTGYHSNSPYTQGTQCSACPSNCNSDKLCDCGGLICRNKGTFNYNCTCTCQANTVGADCGTLVCPSVDPAYPCNYITTTHCPMKWSGTPHYFKYQCPRKCGLCS